MLGARVHYGGVSVSRRALFPHPQAPGPLHNIKKHKQSILNVTQRKSKRERGKKKQVRQRKGFSSVTQHCEIRGTKAGLQCIVAKLSDGGREPLQVNHSLRAAGV